MEISKEAFFNYQVMIGLAEDVFNIKLPILGKKSNPTLDEVLKLAIDEKNAFKNDQEQQETEQLYNEMGLEFSPFRQVKYFYPFSNMYPSQ